MNAPVLSVSDLSVTFRSPSGAGPAVDKISFDLRAGEIVGLVGESGCGKSVTALALLGLIPAARAVVTAASLQLAGRDLPGLPEKSMRSVRGGEIAMIFQEPAAALDPVFTIGGQISNVIRRHRGVKPDAAHRQALQALEQGGFPEPEQIYRAYPHHLSGGMQQLAMIAMAIAVRPRVLIADEPTTALDVTTQALVLERLRGLRDQDAFTLHGERGETVELTLAPRADPRNRGRLARLAIAHPGPRFFGRLRQRRVGALPLVVRAKLRRSGLQRIGVGQILSREPLPPFESFWIWAWLERLRRQRFEGEYCLTVRSTGDASSPDTICTRA